MADGMGDEPGLGVIQAGHRAAEVDRGASPRLPAIRRTSASSLEHGSLGVEAASGFGPEGGRQLVEWSRWPVTSVTPKPVVRWTMRT